MKLSSSRFDMETSRLERPTVKNYGETTSGSGTGKPSANIFTLDISEGNVHNIVLSESTTVLVFSPLVFTGASLTLTCILRQDGFGERKVVWPSGVQWSSGIEPILSISPWAVDVISLCTFDNGVTWTGSVIVHASKEYKKLFSWGRGTSGQIGDATTIHKSSPIQIGSLTDWAQVSAGFRHSATLKNDGSLWTWGNSSFGQLGSSAAVNRSSPMQVGSLTTWSQVSTGFYHTSSLKVDGTLWRWGRNNVGQLGDATTVNKSSPVQIGSLTNWRNIADGKYHTLALKTDGTLWTWGKNNYGQLGDATTVNKSSPVQIGSGGWAQVVCGIYHSLALKTDGTLWSWGQGTNSQLGDGTAVNKSSPIQIGSLTNWSGIFSENGYHSFAVKTDGALWTWGKNNYGQLGDATTVNKSSPIQIGSLTNWQWLSSGKYFSTALKTDGTLWSWGRNDYGQLGSATTVNRSSPVQVGSVANWSQVSNGWYYSLML